MRGARASVPLGRLEQTASLGHAIPADLDALQRANIDNRAELCEDLVETVEVASPEIMAKTSCTLPSVSSVFEKPEAGIIQNAIAVAFPHTCLFQ